MKTQQKMKLFTAASGSLLLAASMPLSAQDAAAPAAPAAAQTNAAPKMTMAERKQSIINIERHIKQRQERVAEIGEDIIRLDKRVEKRIDMVVDMLAKSKDSKSSRVTVAMTKQKAIDGLKRTIEHYDTKRRELREELRKTETLPREEMQADIEKFNARVEKRVEQILTLTKSFTENKDLEKYENHTRSTWGWSWNERRISEDWRQNNRDSRRTKLTNKNVIEALEKSIQSLESRNAWLKRMIEHPQTSEEAKVGHEIEMSQNADVLYVRQSQLDQMKVGPNTPTKAVSRDSAHELANLLDDTAKDIRDDFFGIFAKYSELKDERNQIARLSANLEARINWVNEHVGEDWRTLPDE